MSEHCAKLSQLCSEGTQPWTSPQASGSGDLHGWTHQPFFISDRKKTNSTYRTALDKTSKFQLIPHSNWIVPPLLAPQNLLVYSGCITGLSRADQKLHIICASPAICPETGVVETLQVLNIYFEYNTVRKTTKEIFWCHFFQQCEKPPLPVTQSSISIVREWVTPIFLFMRSETFLWSYLRPSLISHLDGNLFR